MAVSVDEVKEVASLPRLRLTSEEEARFQLVGRRRDERRLLRLAAACEALTGWRRRPALGATGAAAGGGGGG